MKVLLTGFDPFGKEIINPSAEALKKINDKIAGAEIVKLVVPTISRECIRVVEQAIKKHRPDIVICLGLAGGRADITPERVAINIDDFNMKDNAGRQVIDKPIYPDGPDAYFSTLPIKAIVKNIGKHSIRASVSNSAGTFICNHLMYGLMYLIDRKYPRIIGGFIHIPYMTEQALQRSPVTRSLSAANYCEVIPLGGASTVQGQLGKKKKNPSMPLDTIAKGIEYAIEACVRYKKKK